VSVLGPPIPSPPLLSDPGFLGRVRRAAGDALRRLDGSFDAPSVFAEAERFGTRLAFAPPPLAEALRRLRRTGTWAAQAMFGGALFAFAPDPSSEGRLKEELEALGHSALALRSASRGAHTLTRPHGPVRGRQAF
jgi:pantoate kinase